MFYIIHLPTATRWELKFRTYKIAEIYLNYTLSFYNIKQRYFYEILEEKEK